MPFALIHTVDAIKNTDHITVVISDTCKKLILSNSSTYCPTYEDILLIFSDTSDKTRSGNFTYNENGFLERGPAQMQNHREYYRHTQGTVYQDVSNVYWIDPPADLLLSGAKKIIIESNDFTYPIKKHEINDTSIEIGSNRYVSSTCSYSIISAASWIFLLGDTLRYMASGCDNSGNYTFFNDTYTYYWDATPHDITTSKKWIYEQLIKDTKERCNVRCNEYDTVGQNMTILALLLNNTLTIDEILPENVTAQQYLCKETGPLCDFYHYRIKNQTVNMTITEIIEPLGTNQTLTFNETLSFQSQIMINHIVVEPDPCQIAGPLCDYYLYKNKNHTLNTQPWWQTANSFAGAIGE